MFLSGQLAMDAAGNILGGGQTVIPRRMSAFRTGLIVRVSERDNGPVQRPAAISFAMVRYRGRNRGFKLCRMLVVRIIDGTRVP